MIHTVSSSIAPKLRRPRARRMRTARFTCAAILALAAGTVGVIGVASAGAKANTPLIVWIDTSRVAYEKAYMKANPHANIKWVIYNGNANGTGVLQSKFALWNRTGWPSNAPDVMFDTQNYDAVQLGTAPYNDLLNLKTYVPGSVLKNFAKGSLAACTTPTGQVICLRNDSAAAVLWVNPRSVQPVLRQRSRSDDLAGDPSGRAGPEHGASGLPGRGRRRRVRSRTTTCGATSARSTRSSGRERSRSTRTRRTAPGSRKRSTAPVTWASRSATTSVFGSSFNPNKVVMMVGPLWYGTAVFQTGATGAVPNGTMAAYPPPVATNGAHVTGALGGGLWLVSSHAPDPKAAAAFAQYMATSPKIQKVGVDSGLPQYVPDENSYLSSLGSVFADPSTTEAAWKTAAAEVWTGWSPVPWSTDAVWGSTALANLTANPPASICGAAPAVRGGACEPGPPGRLHGQEPSLGCVQRVVTGIAINHNRYSTTQ